MARPRRLTVYLLGLVIGFYGGLASGQDMAQVKSSISAAAALAGNDTSNALNPSSAFDVAQAAGVPAVKVAGPPVVNFVVVSGGKPLQGLKITDVRFAIAKLVQGENGEPDQWVNYVSNTVPSCATRSKPSCPPGVVPVLDSAEQASTDVGGSLSYNPSGFYTYTFKTDITKVPGIAFEPGRTHRVGIQLSYKNADGELVRVNPYFDFVLVNGQSVPVIDANKTRKMADVSSCNSCHDRLALHGGGRVDTQYCVMCHNPGTVDPESGHNLNMATMVHTIHAGKKLKRETGRDYTIWGYKDAKHDFSEVGFPQDLRNCTKCHDGSNPKTPQGDNWKTVVSKEACLTCHVSTEGSSWQKSHQQAATKLRGAGAKPLDLTNQQCYQCHAATDTAGKPNPMSSERVHWNQNEENAAKYKFNIDGVKVLQVPSQSLEGKVQVQYSLTDPTSNNLPYKLEGDPRFKGLRLYVGYQNLLGQPAGVTEFTSYNNGGNNARVDASTGANDGKNRYTAVVTLPANSNIAVAKGTARVITHGAVSEERLDVKSGEPRKPVPGAARVNVLVQNAWLDFALTGELTPRRAVVSNDKCNACHGALGATSGSNLLANAFHGGARTIVQACVVCHDANRSSATKMTNGRDWQESYQFKRMIHGIHGNAKRLYPFTHGNKVVGAFCNDKNPASKPPLCDPQLKLADTDLENYAAEVTWPGVGIDCNACHIDNSHMKDLGTLGSVVSARESGADPLSYLVISPKAATCSACHDSAEAMEHMVGAGDPGDAIFASKTQKQYLDGPKETCEDCHGPGKRKAVDRVHRPK